MRDFNVIELITFFNTFYVCVELGMTQDYRVVTLTIITL